MYTIVKNKPYLIENGKMFAVNISIEKGIEKVGKELELPKVYSNYSYNEIVAKFHIKLGQPYVTKEAK